MTPSGNKPATFRFVAQHLNMQWDAQQLFLREVGEEKQHTDYSGRARNVPARPSGRLGWRQGRALRYGEVQRGVQAAEEGRCWGFGAQFCVSCAEL